MNNLTSQKLAKKARLHTLSMVARSRSSHVGSCFSMADILAVLYEHVMQIDPSQPNAPERDRFILSKGHGTAILYAILAEKGFFPLDWLHSYNFYGAKLLGHCTSKGVPGVELSTGSLGHGLSVGLGMAKSLKLDALSSRVFVLLGDGECNEGSVWEAAMLAPQLKMNNLIAIIDYNKIQSFGMVKEIIDLEPFSEKWSSFGWNVHLIDGHDHAQILWALSNLAAERPTVIICDTVKGKGVSYMENQLAWHYKSPNDDELQTAIHELNSHI